MVVYCNKCFRIQCRLVEAPLEIPVVQTHSTATSPIGWLLVLETLNNWFILKQLGTMFITSRWGCGVWRIAGWLHEPAAPALPKSKSAPGLLPQVSTPDIKRESFIVFFQFGVLLWTFPEYRQPQFLLLWGRDCHHINLLTCNLGARPRPRTLQLSNPGSEARKP